MTIWTRLGIEPTSDLKVIKRTYAKLLKIHHPEDDPEGYQQLREAYDQAVVIAKRMAKQEEEQRQNTLENQQQTYEQNSDFIIPPRLPFDMIHQSTIETLSEAEPEPSIPPVLPFISAVEEPVEQEEPEEIAARLVEQAIAIYDHYPTRITIDAWVDFLNLDDLWNTEIKAEVSIQLLDALTIKYLLPANVIELLTHFFGWQPEEIEHLQEPQLRFDFLPADTTEQFLLYRQQGFAALIKRELEQAYRLLMKAYQIYDLDPDLLRLLGEYHLRNTEYDAAAKYIDKLIELLPFEIDGHLYKARIFYYMGKFEQAIEVCRHIMSRWPEQHEASMLIANCYMSLGQNAKAMPYLVAHTHNAVSSIPLKSNRKRHPKHTQLGISLWAKAIIFFLLIIICMGAVGILHFLSIIGVFFFVRKFSMTCRSLVKYHRRFL